MLRVIISGDGVIIDCHNIIYHAIHIANIIFYRAQKCFGLYYLRSLPTQSVIFHSFLHSSIKMFLHVTNALLFHLFEIIAVKLSFI